MKDPYADTERLSRRLLTFRADDFGVDLIAIWRRFMVAFRRTSTRR